MKKSRTILVGFLAVMVLLTGGYSLNSVAQDSSEVPEILDLNASLDFDKEAIRKWAEEHSWKEARNLALKSYGRQSVEGNSSIKRARLYAPLYEWVEINYRGELNFWSKEKIQEKYQSRLVKPNEGASFFCVFAYKNKSILDTENFNFVLEDEEGRHWRAKEDGKVVLSRIQSTTLQGAIFYLGRINLQFNFSEEKKPSWDKLTLYIIRTDRAKRTELTWDFN